MLTTRQETRADQRPLSSSVEGSRWSSSGSISEARLRHLQKALLPRALLLLTSEVFSFEEFTALPTRDFAVFNNLL